MRILITDSNSRVRDLLRRELEHEGYNVCSSKDGQEILDHITSPGSIDLIILDPQLFCPHGLQMLGDLSRAAQSIPIIIHAFHDQRSRIESLKNVFFVDKDANSIRELKAVVRTCRDQKAGGAS
ncbi:MAG: response regulator [Desulfofustis sp.]|nr:response regulator [Desulfofustis sp.]